MKLFSSLRDFLKILIHSYIFCENFRTQRKLIHIYNINIYKLLKNYIFTAATFLDPLFNISVFETKL